MKRDRRELAAAGFVILGAIVIVVGWVGVSQSNEVYEQMPYLMSGGVGGLACILVGLGLYIVQSRAKDQARMDELNEHLRSLELGLGGEFDEVLERLDHLASNRRSSASVGG
jgi:hypothetical protein